jgi:hypothetical protein
MLQNKDSIVLSKAMTNVILMNVNRMQVLMLVVKLGVYGTENALNELLLKYGDKAMAVDYLNCGSKKLYEGGVAWARKNGYSIIKGPGSSRVKWGSF